jgi:hypothetical protein
VVSDVDPDIEQAVGQTTERKEIRKGEPDDNAHCKNDKTELFHYSLQRKSQPKLLNGFRTSKVRGNSEKQKKNGHPKMPAFGFPENDYFFSGVFTAGGLVGTVFASAFLSSVFFSSALLSSFAGLAVGLTVVDGLEVAAGDAATAGVDAGVAAGLFCTFVSVQAAENADRAAKTVSRNDLLIVFPQISIAKRLSGAGAIDARPAPAGSDHTAGCKKWTGLPLAEWHMTSPLNAIFCNTAIDRTQDQTKLANNSWKMAHIVRPVHETV